MTSVKSDTASISPVSSITSPEDSSVHQELETSLPSEGPFLPLRRAVVLLRGIENGQSSAVSKPDLSPADISAPDADLPPAILAERSQYNLAQIEIILKRLAIIAARMDAVRQSPLVRTDVNLEENRIQLMLQSRNMRADHDYLIWFLQDLVMDLFYVDLEGDGGERSEVVKLLDLFSRILMHLPARFIYHVNRLVLPMFIEAHRGLIGFAEFYELMEGIARNFKQQSEPQHDLMRLSESS